MRTLITLSVLQTIGIVALIVHSFSDQGRVVVVQRPEQPAAVAIPSLADEQRLRTIIKQELAQLQVQPTSQGGASPPPLARARNEPADRRRQELIAQQIETYRATGSITAEQMHELQVGIAQLDDASRKQLMSRLIRALNSGDIKGRL